MRMNANDQPLVELLQEEDRGTTSELQDDSAMICPNYQMSLHDGQLSTFGENEDDSHKYILKSRKTARFMSEF